ncbi:hypothetical protein QUA16_14640 [Microcoleus sp. S13_C3]
MISGELLAKIKSQVNNSVLKRNRSSVPAPLRAIELSGDDSARGHGATSQS